MSSINYELMPIIRMTYPPDRASLKDSETLIPFGKTLFRSTLLLFGFIPIDLHWLCLEQIVEGESFNENSFTLLQKQWKHARSLASTTNGFVILTDSVEFTPRIPLLGYILLPVVKYIFWHRHLQLKKKFRNIWFVRIWASYYDRVADNCFVNCLIISYIQYNRYHIYLCCFISVHLSSLK